MNDEEKKIQMKRILIIGSGGAGKSTLSLKISEITGIPVIHLDSYFWKPDWGKTPTEEWRKIVEKLSDRENWIMDGNYGGTMEMRFEKADTIIFMDIHRITCLYRAAIRRFTQKRVDLIKDCREVMDWEFIKWIWNYPKHRKPEIISRLKELQKTKEVIIIKNKKEREQFIEQFIINIKK